MISSSPTTNIDLHFLLSVISLSPTTKYCRHNIFVCDISITHKKDCRQQCKKCGGAFWKQPSGSGSAFSVGDSNITHKKYWSICCLCDNDITHKRYWYIFCTWYRYHPQQILIYTFFVCDIVITHNKILPSQYFCVWYRYHPQKRLPSPVQKVRRRLLGSALWQWINIFCGC